jgi:hypothetical protein
MASESALSSDLHPNSKFVAVRDFQADDFRDSSVVPVTISTETDEGLKQKNLSVKRIKNLEELALCKKDEKCSVFEIYVSDEGSTKLKRLSARSMGDVGDRILEDSLNPRSSVSRRQSFRLKSLIAEANNEIVTVKTDEETFDLLEKRPSKSNLKRTSSYTRARSNFFANIFDKSVRMLRKLHRIRRSRQSLQSIADVSPKKRVSFSFDRNSTLVFERNSVILEMGGNQEKYKAKKAKKQYEQMMAITKYFQDVA